MVWSQLQPKKSLMVVGGGRPDLVYSPGPGLSPGPDLGPGPELDNRIHLKYLPFLECIWTVEGLRDKTTSPLTGI